MPCDVLCFLNAMNHATLPSELEFSSARKGGHQMSTRGDLVNWKGGRAINPGEIGLRWRRVETLRVLGGFARSVVVFEGTT